MVEHLTADILEQNAGVAHAFFTRRGGVSQGLYASLNVGFGSDDVPDLVAENRARCMRVLDLPADCLTTVYQIHGTTTERIEKPVPYAAAPRADAMVTDRPGVALGILTADCVPVLLADPSAGVVGAAHAGWKGALDDVLLSVLQTMESLGAQRQAVLAAIGPCIQQASYEVGPEYQARFVAADTGYADYFRPSDRSDHFLFDLEQFVADRLHTLGVGAVEAIGRDTCADADDFFSYRRATRQRDPDYGRNLSAIALRS